MEPLQLARADERDAHRFIKVYIFATCVAATIGTIGFALKIPLLTWDDRAKAFLDDPNMYAAFLIPGVFGCLYMLTQPRGRWIYAGALTILLIGMVAGFSRAAVGAMGLWGAVWLIFLNRNNLAKIGRAHV